MSDAHPMIAVLCLQCGQVTPGFGTCVMCGSPVAGHRGSQAFDGQAVGGQAVGDDAVVPALPWNAATPPTPIPAVIMPAVAAPGGLAAGGVTVGGPGPFRPARRRLRGRTIALGIAAVLLLAGGGVAYVVLRPPPPSARAAVQDYFDDLARGDASAALGYVEDAGTDSDPLLVAGALAAPADRPTGATVVDSRADTTADGSRVDVVTVTYAVGGHSLTQQILADRGPGGAAHPFLLRDPFIRLDINDPDGSPVTINGVELAPDLLTTGQLPAFPAAYHATVPGNALFAPVDAPAQYDADFSGDVVATIDVSRHDLAAGATDAVTAQVRQQLDACAASTEATPSGCPFYASPDLLGATLQWTITTYPTVTLSIGYAGDVELSDSAGGAVHYVATGTDFAGTPQTQSGDLTFDISGTVTVDGTGAINVTLVG